MASAHVNHRYTTTCNMKKEYVHVQTRRQKSYTVSMSSFFYLSPATHSFSNKSLCAHKNIYRFQDKQKNTRLPPPPPPTNKLACTWCQFIPQHAAMPKRVSQDILPFYCLTSFADKTSRHTCCSRMQSCYLPLPLRMCNKNDRFCTKSCTSATYNRFCKHSIGHGCFLKASFVLKHLFRWTKG